MKILNALWLSLATGADGSAMQPVLVPRLKVPDIPGRALTAMLTLSLSAACATPMPRTGMHQLQQEVIAAEQAFSASMAARDFDAFTGFIADEAIFFNGETPLRGRDAVLAHWRGYFEGAEAPFSWRPETVEVLASGALALSSGPVYDSSGNLVARFQSTWRREAHGTWRVVFDKGAPACP